MAVVALAILISNGKPVLFRQTRPGRGAQPFVLLKFRTMKDAEADTPDKDRVTRLGRFLRASSLDELPELVNVLRGDMSLVGPRPLLERYLPYFTPEERCRFDVAPGITGWAQVHGRNEVPWDQRLAFDVWYVRNWSLKLDAVIAAKTIAVIISRRGFDPDPESIMENLDDLRRQSYMKDPTQ
jgi:sugar transferase EpsL